MKSPITVSLSALGLSPWIPLNYLQRPFCVSLAVLLTSGANLTYSLQHTYDEPGPEADRLISVSRAATVATVVDVNHKLSVGDNVHIWGTGSIQLDNQFLNNRPVPWAVASIIDANTYTYTVANAGPLVDQGISKGKNFRVFPHSVLSGLTARGESNYNFPPQAVQLVVSAYVSGTADLLVTQGLGS